MSAKVNLTKRINVDGKDRFVQVVQAAKGRVKPDWVVIDGVEQRYPGGRFYIDWTENGRRRRESVGASASNAVARQLRRETELKAVAQGITITPQDEQSKRARLHDAITLYLGEIKLTKKPKTIAAYTTSLNYFEEACGTTGHLDDIKRIDMLRFHAFLRDDKKQSPRSCWNKFSNVMSFLKAHDIRNVVKAGDWPKYVEEEPEIYEREDLDQFFSACTDYERLVYEFFLMTGMREQEVMHAMWKDVNFKQSTVSMRWKPELNWTPKAYKEREIPVPSKLLNKLKDKRPHETKQRGLIFPTSGGKPNGHFLEFCKAIAERAGFDPEEWWLHKFRATFATLHLQAGVDLRTVQKWLGHTDLDSTLRYLKPARGAGVHEKVNATFA